MSDHQHSHSRFLRYWDRCVDHMSDKMKAHGRDMVDTMIESGEADLVDDDTPSDRIRWAVIESLLGSTRRAIEDEEAQRSLLDQAKDILE